MRDYRILSIFAKNYDSGTLTGGHRRYGELVRCLVNQDNQVYLIGPSLTPGISSDDVTLFRISESKFESSLLPNTLIHSFKAIWSALRHLRGKQIDALVVLSLTNGLPAIFIKLFLHCRLVTFLLQDPRDYRAISVRKDGIKIAKNLRVRSKFLQRMYLGVFHFYEKLVLGQSNVIVVESEHYREILLHRYPEKRANLEILPANINTSWIDKIWELANSSDRARCLCFAGWIHQRKGLQYLLEAFQTLANQNDEIFLEVLGVGPLLEEMTQSVSRNPSIQDRVTFHGWVSDPLRIIAQCDLLIVPSLSDSFPEVIGESLYVGTPVLGSRVGGIPEQLEYDVLLFEPGSTKAIVEKLQPIIQSDATYLEIKRLCMQRRRALTFDWGGELQNLLERALLKE
jgi:glycosyltransferase involved in cell wall biosynthesis